MDIRIPRRLEKKFQELYKKSNKINKNLVSINVDNNASEPTIFVHTEDGSFLDWTRGEKNVESFLKNGYVQIPNDKYCPLIKGKCKGEKCAFYIIEHSTGDCSLRWSAIMSVHQG